MAQASPGAGGRGRKAAGGADARAKVGPREARVSTTMRLRRSLRRELEAAAAQRQRSVAEVAQELLEEALRMRQCPASTLSTSRAGEPRRSVARGWPYGKCSGTFHETRIPSGSVTFFLNSRRPR